MADTQGKDYKEDMLKFMQAKYKSTQEKANAIALLAKKYNMPVDKLITNIVKEWVNEDRQKKHEGR
ncbi:MAG: hypothetical protein WCJ46_02105 [bacterium]